MSTENIQTKHYALIITNIDSNSQSTPKHTKKRKTHEIFFRWGTIILSNIQQI